MFMRMIERVMSVLPEMFGRHGPVACKRLISSMRLVFSASILGPSGSWMYSCCLPRCLGFKLTGLKGELDTGAASPSGLAAAQAAKERQRQKVSQATSQARAARCSRATCHERSAACGLWPKAGEVS